MGRLLKRLDDGRRRRMVLAALPELDVARILEPCGCSMPAQDLPLQLGEPDTGDSCRRAGQAEIDDVPGEADRLEKLSAAIRRHVGDAHLGQDLQHAVLDRLAEAQLCLRRRWVISAELVFGGERGNRLEREPRTDRVGSIPEQAGEVVRLAGLLADDDDGRPRPCPVGDEPVVDRADCEHGRDRDSVRAVVEHEHVRARRRGLFGQAFAGAPQSLVLLEGGVERDTSAGQLGYGGWKEEEALQLEQRGGARMLSDQRRASAEQRPERHHRALTQMVDRRIRHLREPLSEVRRQRTCASR
jgi:hypothetical protein